MPAAFFLRSVVLKRTAWCFQTTPRPAPSSSHSMIATGDRTTQTTHRYGPVIMRVQSRRRIVATASVLPKSITHSGSLIQAASAVPFPLPAPPPQKASACQHQARQSGACNGTGDGSRRCPKGIVELKATGHLASRQMENQLDICGAAALKPNVDQIACTVSSAK